MTATASDDTGVASVRFFLDGTRIATVADPPYLATLTLPATLPTGTRLHVEARALDFSGLEAVASQEVNLVAPAAGVVTGEVYDDASGLPIAGASVALLGTDARHPAADVRVRCAWPLRDGRGRGAASWILSRLVGRQPGDVIAEQGRHGRRRRIGRGRRGGDRVVRRHVSGDRLAFLQVWQREVRG